MSTKKERSEAAAILGRKGGRIGGKSRSPAKLAAIARNAQKAGRPSRYRQGWRDAMRRAAELLRAALRDDLAARLEAEPPPGKEPK